MKLFDAASIRKIDAYTIEHIQIASIELMERASRSVFEYIIKHVDADTTLYVFAGRGNNGGDALALARQLLLAGYIVHIYTVFLSEKCSEDCEKNHKALVDKNITILQLNSILDFPIFKENSLLIDGILGTGINRPVSGLLATIIEKMNSSSCPILSIDIPSGLPSDDVLDTHPVSIKATTTITFQFPKLSFYFPEYELYVGNWIMNDIGLDKPYILSLESPFFYIEKDLIKEFIRKRPKFAHKGTFGHALLINGSDGKIGAAILSAKACLRAGVGLLTTYVPSHGNTIMQVSVPEAMCITDKNADTITSIPDETNNFDAIGCGCGIGVAAETKQMLKELMQSAKKPLLLDADALNIIAIEQWQKHIPPHTIITPHPKEFDRLAGNSQHSGERLQKAKRMSKDLNIYIVLKGAHTAVVSPDGTVHFNSTGNPGMATAGSGDVLTGIITSLLAQKYTPGEAAILGVYLHGLAGDCAKSRLSEESLISSDIIDNISESYVFINK